MNNSNLKEFILSYFQRKTILLKMVSFQRLLFQTEVPLAILLFLLIIIRVFRLQRKNLLLFYCFCFTFPFTVFRYQQQPLLFLGFFSPFFIFFKSMFSSPFFLYTIFILKTTTFKFSYLKKGDRHQISSSLIR